MLGQSHMGSASFFVYKQKFGNAVTVSLFSAIAAQIARAIFEAEAKM